jgi:wyosine [tRNA(Phe)-imidazoG37] synthetase (radical SAM superfamily)
MELLKLQSGIIYGPVRSRRLGRSLGINLIPAKSKVCSFDCAYCHYGRTDTKTTSPKLGSLPSVEEVLKKIGDALQTENDLDYLTSSGNGEPTLHPHFAEIAQEVRRLRDTLRPGLKLAILSNSSTIWRPEIRSAIQFLDVPILKLDAGDMRTFRGINRPAADIDLQAIIQGLAQMPGVTIQSVIVDGPVQNVRGEPHGAWLAALARIKPASVQIYSTDLPVAEIGIERVPRQDLEELALKAQEALGVEVKAFHAPTK